jgi:hypothetical protein
MIIQRVPQPFVLCIVIMGLERLRQGLSKVIEANCALGMGAGIRKTFAFLFIEDDHARFNF